MRGILLAALMAAALAVALSACGETGGNGDQASEPVTVTEEKTVREESAPSDAVAPEEAPSDSDSAGSSGGGGEIEVPDVVGKDHQLAQDTMQAAGLYILSEEDATGQGRALIVDRNWTVVEQDPPGGSVVSEDETITLRSKKDGE